MAGVRFEGISKRYGEVNVLAGLDLVVDDGEMVVVVGPSGCGKSTLLRLLAGLETPDAGTIRIGDRRVDDVAPRDRDVAMVFQSYALYPHLTVRRNLAFGLEMRKTPRAETERRVGEVARALGLEPLLERRPAELSGGQRQRVALGRAIARSPSVFLFDEPLSNLDAALRGEMRAELAALQKRLSTTTLYVTHDQVEAMTLGHRVAVLDRGHLQQYGPPREIYDRPANRFVARFIGTPPINLVELEGSRGNLRIPGGPQLPFATGGAAGQSGDAVTLGIRAEALTVLPAGSPAGSLDGPGDRPRVSATVDFVERLGHESHIHLAIAGPAGLRWVAKVPGDSAHDVGHRVLVELDLASAHLFDRATGVRIP
jgi:ABC-type sugar transport system ATPase subunit